MFKRLCREIILRLPSEGSLIPKHQTATILINKSPQEP